MTAGRLPMPFLPTDYGSAAAELLADERLPELGPGTPNTAKEPLLKKLSLEALFCGRRIHDHELANCCVSALWLWHDFLSQSHALSQEIETPEGSYWHGIMHRREPDYGNAKYWFRRVGSHPVLDSLADDVQAKGLMPTAGWDPFAFIDLCQSIAQGRSDRELLARQAAKREWQLLFDFCYRGATSSA